MHRPCAPLALGILAMLLAAGPATATESAADSAGSSDSSSAPAFEHDAWSTLLAGHVDDAGLVSYRDLRDNARPQLDAYLARLAQAEPDAWPRNEQFAFWINAYNAAVVAGVLDGQTPESLFGRARFFRAYKVRVAGQSMTLSTLEHEVIRRRFPDARVHYALVCAASSCPVLRREAFVGARLDEQLDDQGRRFLNDRRRNVVEAAGGRVRLSAIFDWFREDFVRDAGSIGAFAARSAPGEGEAVLLVERGDRVDFLDYDWTLNAAPGQRP